MWRSARVGSSVGYRYGIELNRQRRHMKSGFTAFYSTSRSARHVFDIVPQHHKATEQTSSGFKSHMNFMSMPHSSWKANYKKYFTRSFLQVYSGTAVVALTAYVIYKRGALPFSQSPNTGMYAGDVACTSPEQKVTPSLSEQNVTSPTPEQTMTPPTPEQMMTPPTPEQMVTPPMPEQKVTPTTPEQNVTPPQSEQVIPPPSEQVTPPPSEQVTPPPSEPVILPPPEQVTPPLPEQVTPPPPEPVTSQQPDLNKECTESTQVATVSPPEKVVPTIPDYVPYILIGGGTSSLAAFRSIKANDPKAQVLIVTEEDQLPYMRPPLSKELWFTADTGSVDQLTFQQWNGKERSIYFEPASFYTDLSDLMSSENGGVSVLIGRKVVKVNISSKTIVLDKGSKVRYNKLLIATGGKPKNLPLFDEADPQVKARTVLFRNIDDFKKLHSKVSSAKATVAIIGGGFLGSELACALARKGRDSGLTVHQIFPESGNMGRVLPEYLCKWTTQKIKQEGVNIITNSTVTAVKYDEDKQKVVLTLDDQSQVEADYIVPTVGLRPNTDLARTSKLEVDPQYGGFLVNSELEARRDVWVAGDAACFYDVKLGRRRVEHHDHAVVSGRLAGENMTGSSKPYWHQSMFWSDLGPNIGYEAIGLVDSSLPTTAVFAKATKGDTPQAVTGETGDGLRSEAEQQQGSDYSSSSIPTPNPHQDDPLDDEDYGKGVIFYRRNNTVVGILLWNVFNKIPVARRVLKDGAEGEDLYEVAKLFQLH